MGIYALTVNKTLCTASHVPHQTAEFLSLYVLFNVQRLVYNLIGSITNELQYNRDDNKTSTFKTKIKTADLQDQDTIKDKKPKTINIICLQIYFKFLIF